MPDSKSANREARKPKEGEVSRLGDWLYRLGYSHGFLMGRVVRWWKRRFGKRETMCMMAGFRGWEPACANRVRVTGSVCAECSGRLLASRYDGKPMAEKYPGIAKWLAEESDRP